LAIKSFPYLADFRKPFGVHGRSALDASRFRAGCAATQGEAVFQIVAVPFDAYAALPSPTHRWLLTCLARYADREGKCWPSMRQLAEDARLSLASVCRYLQSMADLGVFHRIRRGVGRYVYTLAAAYVPRWPGRADRRVSAPQRGVSEAETQETNPAKQAFKQDRFAGDLPEAPWQQRLESWRASRFWLAQWGPKPTESGCFAPAAALVGSGLRGLASLEHGL
jgi:hypothetical protein